jgi:uncharacterized protein (TIGR01244 family)
MSETLPVRAIAEGVSVAPQLTPAAMSEVAQAGFRSVINNRPDFEAGPTQPTHAEIEKAAKAAGLEYRFLPVSSSYQSQEDALACARFLAELPRPVLMFCRSGARSTRLYELARNVQSDVAQ